MNKLSTTMYKLTCSTCNERVYVVEGVTAFFDRDCWWHTKCTPTKFVDGRAQTKFFPSEEGKLVFNGIPVGYE